MSVHLARPALLVVALVSSLGIGRVPQGARATGALDGDGYDDLADGFESGEPCQWSAAQW